MKIKIFFIIALLIFTTNCGRSSVDSELIGQVKKVQNNTPLICPDYVTADVSLGVINNGSGSYSNKDIWVVVPENLVEQFKQANKSGEVVVVNYDAWRVAPCSEYAWATSIKKQ